jgi:hypothetical protein
VRIRGKRILTNLLHQTAAKPAAEPGYADHMHRLLDERSDCTLCRSMRAMQISHKFQQIMVKLPGTAEKRRMPTTGIELR